MFYFHNNLFIISKFRPHQDSQVVNMDLLERLQGFYLILLPTSKVQQPL